MIRPMIRTAVVLTALLALAACGHMDLGPMEELCDPDTHATHCEHERDVKPFCPLDPKSCEDLEDDYPSPWDND